MKKLMTLGVVILAMGNLSIAQEGFFIEAAYKMGRTSMSYAYATWQPVGANNSAKDFQLHKDGFFQNNFKLDVGQNGEVAYYRINVDGLFYGLADLVSDGEGKTGPLKSKYRKYNDLETEYTTLKDNAPETYYKNTVHPLSGGGDYKWLDFDFAVGGESLKIGLHYAFGFLGANGGNNGITLSDYAIRNYGAASFNLGYQQYGLKTMLFNSEDFPIKASLGFNRLSTVHKKVFEKRKGFGIDFDAKYIFNLDGINPYVSFYYEFKKFKSADEPSYFFNNSRPAFTAPKLVVNAIGINIGVQIN